MGFGGGVGTADSAIDTGVAYADSADTVDTPFAGDTADTVDTSQLDDANRWVLYAVRHAEKEEEGDDPALTAEGAARAEALAVRLADVPLVTIYATDLLRTQQTVQPTADDHALPVVIDVEPEQELADLLLSAHLGDAVLHAGHSYTLPGLFYALNAEEVDVDGYGQMWVVTGDATGALQVVEEFVGEESTE